MHQILHSHIEQDRFSRTTRTQEWEELVVVDSDLKRDQRINLDESRSAVSNSSGGCKWL